MSQTNQTQHISVQSLGNGRKEIIKRRKRERKTGFPLMVLTIKYDTWYNLTPKFQICIMIFNLFFLSPNINSIEAISETLDKIWVTYCAWHALQMSRWSLFQLKIIYNVQSKAKGLVWRNYKFIIWISYYELHRRISSAS